MLIGKLHGELGYVTLAEPLALKILWILSILFVLKQKTGPDHVDIITFYNEIFIPAVKPLLVELAPGGSEQGTSHTSEAKNNADG